MATQSAYDPETGEYRDLWARAVEVAEFDPAFAARVAGELKAGPITRERFEAAARELAGVGATLAIRVVELDEIDAGDPSGALHWFGAGWASNRPVAFAVPTASAVPMRAVMDRGEPVFLFVPPVELIELPDGILEPEADR